VTYIRNETIRNGAPGSDSSRHRRTSLNLSREVLRELKALAQPSWWRAALAIGADWAQIVAAGAAIYWAVWLAPTSWALAFLPVGWLVIGTRMRALATILHEAAHRILFRRRWLNILLGTVMSGWWILQLHCRYFSSHVQGHHVWLGHPKKDPDIAQYHRLRLASQHPATFLQRNLLQMLLGLKTFVNLPYLLRDRLLPEPGMALTREAKFETVGFVIAWIGLFALLVAEGWLLPFLLIWVVPYLTVFQAVNHLIETLEHFPLTWTRANGHEWTRNRKGPWIEQWLTGSHGEGWHRVHHLLPCMPFWNLKLAHELLMTEPTYAAFEMESGGILFHGTNGEPPILKVMLAELAAYQQALAIEFKEIQ
jgi:fatty acid desaturase